MKTGTIYFVQKTDGMVKVGFTTTLSRRLTTLSKSHGPLEVLGTINGDKQRERSIHRQLERFNVYGEWFRGEGEVIDYVRSLKDGAAVEIAETEARRHHLEGEERMAAEAQQIARRILRARRQRTGGNDVQSLEAIKADHRVSRWALCRIIDGRASTVTAFMMTELKRILRSELEACLEHIERKLEEADEETTLQTKGA
ncbi:MAG: hypothetical protein Kow0026_08520 [Oricola sp.]